MHVHPGEAFHNITAAIGEYEDNITTAISEDEAFHNITPAGTAAAAVIICLMLGWYAWGSSTCFRCRYRFWKKMKKMLKMTPNCERARTICPFDVDGEAYVRIRPVDD